MFSDHANHITIEAIAPASVPVASASICCFTSSLVRRTWSRRRATRSAFFERAFERGGASTAARIVDGFGLESAPARMSVMSKMGGAEAPCTARAPYPLQVRPATANGPDGK